MNLPPDITWRIASFDETAACPWEEILAPAERERLTQWKHEKRRREFIAGRVAARLLVADRLGIDPAAVPIDIQDTGAVHVGAHDLYLSISHSGDQAAAVVGGRPVGVDLERITPRHAGLHRFILHPDEYGLLDRLSLERKEALILCWALKEAALKAGCTGFRRSPKSLRLEIDAEAGSASVHAEDARYDAAFSRAGDAFLAIAYVP